MSYASEEEIAQRLGCGSLGLWRVGLEQGANLRLVESGDFQLAGGFGKVGAAGEQVMRREALLVLAAAEVRLAAMQRVQSMILSIL